MLVVAILGVIAAIAIPTLNRFKLRARSAEAGANLAAIRLAEKSYFTEYSYFVSATASPPSNGGATGQLFSDTSGNFAILGWSPEGQVYFQYAVAVSGLGFTADAAADLDTDTDTQVWGYVHPEPDGTVVPGVLTCSGVWSGSSNNGLDMVGPCDVEYGRSIF
jgi:type IV pilus assembly protein PilA